MSAPPSVTARENTPSCGTKCALTVLFLREPKHKNPEHKEPVMAIKILFAPNHPKPILDVALALKPPGFDLMIHDNGTPEYYRAAAEAEYYLGATRSLDAKFFEAAKKMR